jgi:hypothetical protein
MLLIFLKIFQSIRWTYYYILITIQFSDRFVKIYAFINRTHCSTLALISWTHSQFNLKRECFTVSSDMLIKFYERIILLCSHWKQHSEKLGEQNTKNIVMCSVNINGVWIGSRIYCALYTHNSYLHVTIALLLKHSLQYTTTYTKSAVSSPVFAW